MATPEIVKSTNVKQLPNSGGFVTSTHSNLQGTQVLSAALDGAWFKNTWKDENKVNAVELFPYKLIQLDAAKNETVESFTLPISPQQLTISTPFAIVTTPTLNGIVEEHNSVRFKDIEIAGTMGVFPADRDRDFGALQYRLYDPTGIVDNIDSIAASIPLVQLLAISKETLVDPSNGAVNSGYANLHRLRIFLESYAEQKKTNKDLRLVFASYKDNQYYYVAPTSFSVRRSASNPMEYEYSLGMRSWGAYDPSVSVKVFHEPTTYNPIASVGLALSSFAALPKVVKGVGGIITDVKYYWNAGPQSSLIGNLTGASAWASLSDYIDNPTDPLLVQQVNELKAQTENASSAVAQSLGLSPSTVGITDPLTGNPIVNTPPSSSQQGEASSEQMNILFGLNDLKINLDHLTASLMAQAPTQANPLDYVAGLASKSGVAFQTSVSKYPVSFPANATLEHLSAKYLNDPNRWIEIATLNGLKAPYVDNKGFDVPLLFDGAKSKVIIRTDALDIGKYVTLSSRTQPRKTYGVVSYKQNGYYYEVTLDNDPFAKLPNSNNNDDVSRYKVADLATLHYYTPDTVHAGQILYIPSNETSNINQFNTNQIPSLKQYEDEIRISGVDMLLAPPAKEQTSSDITRVSSTLDLVIEGNDVALSYGMTNLKQALYLILFTPQGSILQHPEFGIGTVAGQSNADVNYDSFNQSIKKAILQDKSFSDVEFITSSIEAGVLTISLGVRIAQLNKVLPVAFDINLKGA